MKILMASLQHETNTFSPIPALYEDFVKPDLWPKMLTGTEMFYVLEGMNLPSTGFMQSAREDDHELIPVLWCSAEPCGAVRDAAFERISQAICQQISDTPDIDAVYLELHGAMVTESYDDAEGELLARVRKVLSKDIPIAVSLDFHANISPAMVELSDLISVYRTYPHIDMAETGERVYRYLQTWMEGGLRFKCLQQIPYLIPLSAQCTDETPNKQLFNSLEQWDSTQGLGVELALGFPPSDIHDAGPAIVAYGSDEAMLKESVQQLYSAALAAEKIYKDALLSPTEAIKLAGNINEGEQNTEHKPVILADVQDNSGAGATSDTTGILAAMIAEGVKQGLVAALCDPKLVTLCQEQGEGAELYTAIGNHYGYDKYPLEALWRVEKVSDGRFACSGEMYRGAMADVGGLALLRLVDSNADITVVVSQDRFQCVDRGVFEHLGVSVEDYGLVVLKSTVHFRADFEPIASRILQVASPGAHPCQLKGLAYQHLRSGVRLGPCGPTYQAEVMLSSEG